jgi:ketosteroid isomerase-like protein
MSKENVELVRGFFELFQRHVDTDAYAELLAPDAECHTPPAGLQSRVIKGASEIQRFWQREFAEAWDVSQSSDQLDEIFDLGDQVAVVVRSHGAGRGSGATVEVQGGAVFDLRERKIVRVPVFSTRTEALEAAGLRE